jgi:hypothetical protein
MLRHLTYCLSVLLFCTGCEEKQPAEEVYQGPAFVRFFLLVDANEQPLLPGQVDAGLLPRSEYVHTSLAALRVPVTLTAAAGELGGPVEVSFTAEVEGDYQAYTLSPANILQLSPENPVDTLTLTFAERWTAADSSRFRLRLTGINAGAVELGLPGTNGDGTELLIELGELDPTYRLSTNRLELAGELGETVAFSVAFPQGFLPDELPDSLFRIEAGFAFSLVRQPLSPGARQIAYRLTLDEALDQDDLSFESRLTLLDLPGYRLLGGPALTVVKPPLVLRDNSLNVAAAFYNLEDRFHRTYGVHWFDFEANDTCEWEDFFAFTFPVVVDANHPHAVLYDDQGTADPRDDLYHHAFRIGFNVVTGTNTTNSFNLKRWFDNESGSAANSPGFNITEALEFYPENGDNANRGTVVVLPQDIVIGSLDGVSYTIAIEGEGTYERLLGGRFEVSFELRATNQALFGGTRADQYRLYTDNQFDEPAELSQSCASPITL